MKSGNLTQHAQAKLERLLIKAFGRDLIGAGVTGYGARWDNDVNGIALGVTVDIDQDPAVLQKRLPQRIDGVPVRVFVQPPAVA